MQIIVLTFAKLQGRVSISRVCALQRAHNNIIISVGLGHEK